MSGFSPRPRWRLQRGLTLIELMVTLLIAMVMSIALFGILAVHEGRKRITTGVNDIEQAGQLALYLLDEWARSAGSGFAAQAGTGYGCSLRSRSASGQTLPKVGAFPAPFASANPGSGVFALAPMLILPGQTTPSASGQTSDVLVMMGGAAGLGGAPLVMKAAPTDSTLTLNNSVAVAANDLLLLVDASGGPAAPCLITQVASVSGGAVTLGGNFYASSIGGTNVGAMSIDSVALPLGNPSSNPPQFLMLGVGEHDTLYSYDLLQSTGADQALAARVQGVFELHAVYGVDTNGDGKVDSWVSPASGDYAYTQLAAGTTTANARLQRIKQVRVALILRVPLKEKASQVVTPSSLSWFADLSAYSLQGTRTLTDEERRYRYRVVESTLVLRNNLMLN